METFTLSRKELHRPGLLKALCGGRLTNAQVAAALRITVRQVRRLKRRFEAGGPGARARQPRPSLAPAVARGGAGRGRAADDDRLRGLQRHAPDREAAGASRPGHLARDGAAVPRAAWPPSEARAPGAESPEPAGSQRRPGGLDPDRRQPLPLARGPRPRADAPRRHRRRHERDPRLTVPPGRGRPWLRYAV